VDTEFVRSVVSYVFLVSLVIGLLGTVVFL